MLHTPATQQRYRNARRAAVAFCFLAIATVTTQAAVLNPSDDSRPTRQFKRLDWVLHPAASRTVLRQRSLIRLQATAAASRLATHTELQDQQVKPFEDYSMIKSHHSSKAEKMGRSGSKPVDPDAKCPVRHFRHQCEGLKGCIWCINKFSPWPGSDGVCIAEQDAWELPDWTYECLDNVPALAEA